MSDPFRAETPWPRVEHDLALAARRPARGAARASPSGPAPTPSSDRARGARRSPAVRFDNDASDAATVIDVHTADGIGVLYRITRALAEFDVDIRSARVQTLGTQVVDAFYVVDADGAKITDAGDRGRDRAGDRAGPEHLNGSPAPSDPASGRAPNRRIRR